MKIRLLDWDSVEHFVEIPDDTPYISGEIVSGDMVMLYPFRYDTGADTRIKDYHDGSFEVEAKDFERLNSLKNSYDVWELDECM